MHIGKPLDSIRLAAEMRKMSPVIINSNFSYMQSRTNVDGISDQGILRAFNSDNTEVGRARVDANADFYVRSVRGEHPVGNFEHVL